MAGLRWMQPVAMAVTLLVLLIALLGHPVMAGEVEASFQGEVPEVQVSDLTVAERILLAESALAADEAELVPEAEELEAEPARQLEELPLDDEETTEGRKLWMAAVPPAPRDLYACEKNPITRTNECKYLKTKNYRCCKGRCAFVRSDKNNCGYCGNVCSNDAFRARWSLPPQYKLRMFCCLGKCVNLVSNWYNCGKCFNRCRQGGKCSNGVCTNNY